MRLPNFDYSQNGAYFITIRTHHAECLFGAVGVMTQAKRMMIDTFFEVIHSYPRVYCPKMVVMPNHVHAVIVIQRADVESAPTIADIVQSFKRYSTIRYCTLVNNGCALTFQRKLWQRSYYDRVIRSEQEYIAALKYIDENPLKWKLSLRQKIDL